LDVAPEWRHPVSGLSVAELVAALPEESRAAVVRLAQA
jgi:2-amino-4-hydroxy-6-hydroxymethyldihydropteridine diphosphokinase